MAYPPMRRVPLMGTHLVFPTKLWLTPRQEIRTSFQLPGLFREHLYHLIIHPLIIKLATVIIVRLTGTSKT